MPKMPRNISGSEIIQLLKRFGYIPTRQTGSHIRLTASLPGGQHHLTIPSHSTIKIGTLNKIFKDLADHLGLNKEEVVRQLFE